MSFFPRPNFASLTFASVVPFMLLVKEIPEFHEVFFLNVYHLYFSLYSVLQNRKDLCLLVNAHFWLAFVAVRPPLDCKLESRNPEATKCNRAQDWQSSSLLLVSLLP